MNGPSCQTLQTFRPTQEYDVECEALAPSHTYHLTPITKKNYSLAAFRPLA
jgi:hypothetical protein